MDPDPRTSSIIDPVILRSYAEVRERNASGKWFALIKTTTHPTLPLAIHNYTHETMFKGVWDPLTIAARTLVTETTTGAVISRSFSKFHNYHERHAYKPTGSEYSVVVEEKLDGSIASLFCYNERWMVISKSQFDGPHVSMAREILEEKYPGVTSALDKGKTYVFEVIHPGNAVGVLYDQKDLVLLAIFAPDGREPSYNFDWTVYPFKRPRVHDLRVINLNELQSMNLENEEGFVVKFWRTPDDERPQRVKVKFEGYLNLIKSKHRVSPMGILEYYISSRLSMHDLDDSHVKQRMERTKDTYIRSLEGLADDLGGIDWIRRIGHVWTAIDRVFVEKEQEWRRVKALLVGEGFTGVGNRDNGVKNAFAKRVLTDDVEKWMRPGLFSWYSGGAKEKELSMFLKGVKVPVELRSSTPLVSLKEVKVTNEVIGLDN